VKQFQRAMGRSVTTKSRCQGAARSKDGKTLLVQCMVEKEIQVLSFDGKELKMSGAIKVNGGPSGIRTAER
jgi:hypothetical protein